MNKRPDNKNMTGKFSMSFQAWLVMLFVIMFTASVFLLIYNYVVYKNEKEVQIANFLDNNDNQISAYVNDLLIDLESMSLLPLFREDDAADFFGSYEQLTNIEGVAKPEAYLDHVDHVLSLLYNYKPGTVNSVFFFHQTVHMNI